MKAIFVILFVYFVSTAKATNYYFSSASGNDSRSSTQAQDPSTPWKTLTKLNSFFSTLKPGDSVLFKRNEIFYGSILINKSGISGSPIVLGAFGAGNRPVITGLQTISSWVSKGNGIYESYNSALGTSLNMVLLNNVEQQIGRYPNADAADGGYLYFETHVGTTSITDDEMPSGVNWTGAQIVIRERRWKLDRATILSQSKNTITHTGTTGEPYNDYGYFIQNDIRTLDEFGEWYYNASTHKLSVYFGSSSPSSYAVEAAALTDLVTNNFAYIVFDNLAFKGANQYTFNVNGSNTYIQNCDISFSGKDAVYLVNSSSLKIEGCTISNSNNNAISLGSSTNAIIRNNKIKNTCVIAGLGSSGDGCGVAVKSKGDGNTIELNEIKNTGYIPISFTGGNYVTVKNNYIDSFCFVKDDGGGIYAYGGDNNQPLSIGRKIIDNIITNGIGAPLGTGDLGKRSSQGIYLDGNTSGVEITGNTVSQVSRGLYMHNSRYVTVNKNTFFNNSTQMYVKEDEELDPMRNNTVTNNIAFSNSTTQLTLSLNSNLDDINLFGRFDSNYYARPFFDNISIATNYVKNPATKVIQFLDLSDWQDKYNKDKASKTSPKQIKPYKINKLIGTNKIDNGFFSDLSGISTSVCSIALKTNGLLDDSYLEVTPTGKGSTIYMKAGNITAGKSYVLRFSVQGTIDTPMTLSTFLRQSNAPYSILTKSQYSKITTSRTENEILFTPSVDEASTSVVIKVDDANKYYIDNIELYETEATITNPDDSIRFEYNTTSVIKSIALDGSYIDVQNKQYSNNLTLQPFSSVVLMRNNNKNLAPTVSFSSPLVGESFIYPSTLHLTAEPSDADGSVTKVEFFNGPTLIKTEYEYPYTCSVKSLPVGTYTFTAKATDNSGATASTSITVSLKAKNIAPKVSITSPTANKPFNSPATINITADAKDTDGSVAKVDFFLGTTWVKTEYIAPYTCKLSNVASGSYTLTAIATDDNGAVTTSTGVPIIIKATTAGRIGSPDSNEISVSKTDESLISRSPVVSHLNVFPNPAINTIQVSFEGPQTYQKADLSIVDLTGKIVKRIPLVLTNNQIKVDISSLQYGVYILRISNDNIIVNQKFMKVNN